MKRIIKQDPEVRNIAKDALYCITKATELFLGYVALRSASNNKKRKTINLQMFQNVIHSNDKTDFLRLDFPLETGRSSNTSSNNHQDVDVFSSRKKEKDVVGSGASGVKGSTGKSIATSVDGTSQKTIPWLFQKDDRQNRQLNTSVAGNDFDVDVDVDVHASPFGASTGFAGIEKETGDNEAHKGNEENEEKIKCGNKRKVFDNVGEEFEEQDN